jgi:hypothetical protein
VRRTNATLDDQCDFALPAPICATLARPPVRSPRHHARRRVMVDGLELRVLDDTSMSGVELGRALRILARLLVRPHQADGDHEASPDKSPSLRP